MLLRNIRNVAIERRHLLLSRDGDHTLVRLFSSARIRTGEGRVKARAGEGDYFRYEWEQGRTLLCKVKEMGERKRVACVAVPTPEEEKAMEELRRELQAESLWERLRRYGLLERD